MRSAGLLDGRWRTLGVLILTTLAAIFVGAYEWSQTEAFRRDCGLGQGFGLFFAAAATISYPVASGVVFGCSKVLADAWSGLW